MVFLGILICVVLFSASAFGFTRHIYQGVFQYSTGRVVPGGTVTVYLAETETLATIYEQETGGSAVEGSQVTSDNNGHYYFFVDEGDYTSSQRFKVVLSKTGYVSQAYDYLEIIPSGTYSGEFDLSDDGILAFGDDEDFGWRYNSTSGNFELVNAVNYVLAWYTPTGGLGTASIANPAINLYDSDATGADRNDEEVGSWTGGFSTVTEDAEISDWAITSFGAATPGTEFTNVFWDGDQAHLYLGVLANYTGANPSVAPLTVADYESLALDFDYAAGTVRLYSPISSTTDIYAADLDWTLGQVTIHAQDPGVVLDEITEGDTDFWLGNNADQGGDDNDLFQIGTGTTIGTNAKITMDTDGNVGIGTASPGEKLEVDGAIKLGTTETEEPLEGTLRWTGADFEGYTLSGWQSLVVSETDFSSEGLSLDDNVALTFGDDTDFSLGFSASAGTLQVIDPRDSITSFRSFGGISRVSGVQTYYVDSTVTDQGAASVAGDRSIKDLVDAIGTSKEAVIECQNQNASGNTTEYAFSTSEEIPDNITLVVENGAVLVLGEGVTLTVDPSRIMCGKRQRIKSGDGTFVWSKPGASIYAEWFGAKADNGVTDSTDAIQEAVDTLGDGITLELGATDATHFYKITSAIEISANYGWAIKGAGRGGSKLVQYTDDTPILELGKSTQYPHFWEISGLNLSWDSWQTASDTNSYAIRFVNYTAGGDALSGPWAGVIQSCYIVGGFRGIGIAESPETAMIAVWMMDIRDIVSYATVGATIWFKSPVAVGMPNNIFTNVYVSQRDITPTEPGFQLHVQSEGKLLNCAVEGSQGKAVYISDCPSFTVENMHLESGTLGDDEGLTLIEIPQTNLVWTGGSITLDDIDTTTAARIFYFYSASDTGYNNAVIQAVRTKIIGVTAGDTYFVKTNSSYLDITLEGNHETDLTGWYEAETITEQCIRAHNGIHARNELLVDDATLSIEGTSYLRPGAAGPPDDMAVTLPDGEVPGTIKHIWKGGDATYTATVTISTHQLGTDVVREFSAEDSYMALVWDGRQWRTLEENLNEELTLAANGAIPPNGSNVCYLHTADNNVTATLADADRAGTWKYIRKNVDANTATITVAKHIEGNPTSIVLADQNDYVVLRWSGYEWATIQRYADGAYTFGDALAIEKEIPTISLNDTTTDKTADAFITNTANDDDDAVLTMGVDDSTGDDTTYVELDGVNEQVEIKKKTQIGTTIHFSNVTTLSTAQVNALKATPITLVPAQGANTIIELVSVMLTYDYATAAFTVGADEDLVIEYADGTDTTASIETTGFLDQAADKIQFYPSSLAAGASLGASINQGLQIFNTGSGELSDGGGELDVRITYRVYETGF
jgi:hypothetical protein